MALVAGQASVAGTWEIVLHTQAGETTWVATFEQDGGVLSGEIDMGNREVYPLQGQIDGDVVTFEFVVSDVDGDQPIQMSGDVDGDAIAGDDGSFIWFGDGNWSGVRRTP